MKHLEKLCEDLNIPSPTSRGESTYIFSLNEQLQIDITTLESGVFFYSPITQCPKKKKEELFIYLMKANLFGQGTLGATIGLYAEENLLTLSLALTYDMNYTDFKGALEDFANIVLFWREEIKHHNQKAANEIL